MSTTFSVAVHRALHMAAHPEPRGKVLHLDPDGALWQRILDDEPGAHAELVRKH